MSEDFFNDLGKTITKAANAAVDKTTELFEVTKIKAQISGEGKSIEKDYRDIGEIVYKRHKKDAGLADDLAKICDDVRAHEERIKSLRKELANIKGMNLCPNCEGMVDKAAAFCPGCGSSMGAEEAKDDTKEEDIVETVEAVAEEVVEEVEFEEEPLAAETSQKPEENQESEAEQKSEEEKKSEEDQETV